MENKLIKRIIEKNSKVNFNEKMVFPTKNLLIEVTNFCNNRCIFCANSIMKRKKEHIKSWIVYKTLKEAYDLGMREVGFYATGEPLLNNSLEDYIYQAKKIGFEYIYITTNGILAELSKLINLYEKGLDSIKFSVNAINSGEYRIVHKTDMYYKVMDNLNSAYQWKLKNNVDINIFVSYVLNRFNYHSIEKIEKFFENKCDEVIIQKVTNQGGLIPNFDKIAVDEEVAGCINNDIKLPCNYPFNSIVVTCEGFLTACCMDFENNLVYADLNTTSLEESWNNRVIKMLRKKHINKEMKNTLCQSCYYKTSCSCKPLLSM